VGKAIKEPSKNLLLGGPKAIPIKEFFHGNGFVIGMVCDRAWGNFVDGSEDSSGEMCDLLGSGCMEKANEIIHIHFKEVQ